MNNTRSLEDGLRQKVLKRDNHTCRYCGNKTGPFHMDHVYPFVKGGETTIDNLVTACQRCNAKKHAIVGVWPKPIGYFDKPKPSAVSFVLAVACLVLYSYGVQIWSMNHDLAFWMFVVGSVFGFISAHTKRLNR